MQPLLLPDCPCSLALHFSFVSSSFSGVLYYVFVHHRGTLLIPSVQLCDLCGKADYSNKLCRCSACSLCLCFGHQGLSTSLQS